MHDDVVICGGLAAGAAWLASFLLSRLGQTLQFGLDNHFDEKPQRFHHHQVCRLGGIAIMAGFGTYFLLSLPLGSLGTTDTEPFPIWIVFVALPVFAYGIVEDCWGNLSARKRLMAATMSALGAGVLLNAVLPIPEISDDGLGVLCWLFTCVCVVGVTNAMNIIDGLNGLASGVSVIIMTALGWIAHGLGDPLLAQLCIGIIASTLGFMLVNFPFGKIFLGDGGAYLLGFLIAECSILLLVRHPEVTWFFPLALAIYPVTETLFSMYRKVFLRGNSAMKPDGVHFHMLIHQRLNRWAWGRVKASPLRNSLSTTFFWVWQGMSTIVGVLIWDQKSLLMAYCVFSVVLYLGMYRMLVRFKAPKWMRIISPPLASQQEFDLSGPEQRK